MNQNNYESDDKSFPAEAYKVNGWNSIAWRVYGWETQPDEDTEWSGYETRTGNIICVMVGDDRQFSFNPEDVTALNDGDYCSECGQIGCKACG